MVEQAMQPAADELLILGLVRLSKECGKFKRKDDDRGADVEIEAYVERLRAYPGDIALAALIEWPNRSNEWPWWKDLRDILEPMVAGRRALQERTRVKPALLTVQREEHDPEVAAKLRGLAQTLAGGLKVTKPRTGQSMRERLARGDAS